jgi:TRAP-type C4-dicarboxylate transport system substrate-binding protein
MAAAARRPQNRPTSPEQETHMGMTRREWIAGMAAAGALPMSGAARAQAGTLKISHQFPGGTINEGDFRDRLCRRFAADIEKRSNGALKAAVYPGSSLMKTNAQFSAMRKGALDISLYPLPYAGGEVPETNIGLMPALVPSYEVGAQWKTSEVGKMLAKTLDEKGIVILSWIWQAGGVASRNTPLVQPEDAKGLKVRGGSREMDMMLKAAGASVISLPSNEIYAAMQTGAMDAAMTSSTSFISFKLEEIAKHLTSGRNKAYWFMFEPLLMSKEVFAKLPKAQQDIIMQAGAEQEKFATDAARADDKIAAEVYAKAGAKVYDLDEATVRKWQTIARDTAWKDYGARGETEAALLKAAQKLIA